MCVKTITKDGSYVTSSNALLAVKSILSSKILSVIDIEVLAVGEKLDMTIKQFEMKPSLDHLQAVQGRLMRLEMLLPKVIAFAKLERTRDIIVLLTVSDLDEAVDKIGAAYEQELKGDGGE